LPYKDPEKRRKHQRDYYLKNIDKRRKYQREYCREAYRKLKENPEAYQKRLAYYRRSNREQGERLKREVISHYSNGSMACANPFGEHKEPYTNILALSIDHIHGGGNKLRKGYGNSFYYWLKRNGFPEGFQVLCMNCQWIKRHENNELKESKPR